MRHAFKNDSNQVAGGTDVPFFIFTRVFYTFLNITIILVLRYSSLVSVVHENSLILTVRDKSLLYRRFRLLSSS